jgi:hypothetical protein
MISEEQAEEFAHAWIAAFNRHDLQAVLSHYADDIEFTSPMVIHVLREHTGTIRGKERLREYFGKALAESPDLRLELLHVLTGLYSVTLVYRSVHRDRLGAEVMVVNEEGLVTKAFVHYGPASASH